MFSKNLNRDRLLLQLHEFFLIVDSIRETIDQGKQPPEVACQLLEFTFKGIPWLPVEGKDLSEYLSRVKDNTSSRYPALFSLIKQREVESNQGQPLSR